MQIIKFTGKNLENARQVIIETVMENPDAVFVLDNKELNLYDYIDQLECDERVLLKMRMCKEVSPVDLTLRIHNLGEEVDVHSVSDLLEKMDMSTGYKYTIIVNDNLRSTLAEVFQQLVYINIPLVNVSIMLRNEIGEKGRLRQFIDDTAPLSQIVEDTIEKMENLPKREELSEITDEIMSSLNHIRYDINRVKNIELKISVAASKKTGKSVMVNSMIGSEIAPTGLELATPNNCIYKKSDDNMYHLEWGERPRMDFATREEIQEYIIEAFKNAQNDKDHNYTIDDMTVYYVPTDGIFDSYTIYDTPGPDLSGANHHVAAKKAMEEADVIIFAIDYGKYLTESELAYLQDIRDLFEKNHKYYSLVFVVNKLDLRYGTDNDKSVTRILDFMRTQLINRDENLKDCIIMGTSALQYFCCMKAPTLPQCEKLAQKAEDDREFGMVLDECLEKYVGKREMTCLNFVSEQWNRLRRFHSVRCSSLKEIQDYSGLANLFGYIEYLTKGKAVDEVVKSIGISIDREYTKIANFFKMQELEEEISKNREKAEEIRRIVKKFLSDIKALMSNQIQIAEMNSSNLKMLNYYVANYGKETGLDEKESITVAEITELTNKNLDSFIMKGDIKRNVIVSVEKMFKQSIKEFCSKEREYKYIQLSEYEEFFNETVGRVNEEIARLIHKNYTVIVDIQRSELEEVKEDIVKVTENRIRLMKEYYENCKTVLEEKYNRPFDIVKPTFTFSLKSPEIGYPNVNLGVNEFMDKLQHMLLKEVGGIHQAVRNVFRKDAGKDDKEYMIQYDEETFEENFDKIRKSLVAAVDDLKLYAKQYEFSKEIMSNTKEFLLDIEKQFMEFNARNDVYVEDTVESMDRSKKFYEQIEKIEERKAYLETIIGNFEPFFRDWQKVRGEDDLF